MKLHVGVDVNSGAVHSVVATAANRSDIEQLPKLLGDFQKPSAK
jgi:IS5 family transposase